VHAYEVIGPLRLVASGHHHMVALIVDVPGEREGLLAATDLHLDLVPGERGILRHGRRVAIFAERRPGSANAGVRYPRSVATAAAWSEALGGHIALRHEYR